MTKMAVTNIKSTTSNESLVTSAPDSFKYETKFIVLSFLNELNKRQRSNVTVTSHSQCSSSTDSDQRARKYFNLWQGKYSLLQYKEKVNHSEVQKRNIHSHPTQSSLRKSNSKGASEKAKLLRKYSLPVNGSSYSGHNLKLSASTPGMLNRSQSLSSGSSHSIEESYSYNSDADDEMEVLSQGSGALGSSLSKSGSKVREHFQYLSTVLSESETEPDQQGGSGVKYQPDAIDQISIEHPKVTTSYVICASRDDTDGIIKLDGENNTDSDISDLELDYNDDLSAKGGGEVSVFPNGKSGVVDRSCLHLDLIGDTSDQTPEKMQSIVHSLQEEVQEQMLYLESEYEDAVKNQIIPKTESPFETPLTPQSECARLLAVIGDDIDLHHRAQIESAVGQLFGTTSGFFSYETFRSVASEVLDENMPGWRQVAVLLMYSQGVAIRLVDRGSHNFGQLVDYSVQLLTDLAAGFIIQQGGWGAVMNSDPSLTSTTTHNSSESECSMNPFLLAMLEQQQRQTEDSIQRQHETGCYIHREAADHISQSEHSRPTDDMTYDVHPSTSYAADSLHSAPYRKPAHETTSVKSPDRFRPSSQRRQLEALNNSVNQPRERTADPNNSFFSSLANNSSWILNRLLTAGQRFSSTTQISATFLILAAGVSFTVAYFKSRSAQ